MPIDDAKVVMVKGADGEPLRIDATEFERDQSDEGEKNYELHPDHEQYDHNGIMINPNTNEPGNEPMPGQSPDDAKANMIDNPNNQNTTSLTGEDRVRADRIAAINFGVVQEGKKFFVVDMNNEGKRIDDVEGINPKGYKSNKEAWDALFVVRTEATNITPVTDANKQTDAAEKEGEQTGGEQQ
jgi:hypothetical protein